MHSSASLATLRAARAAREMAERGYQLGANGSLVIKKPPLSLVTTWHGCDGATPTMASLAGSAGRLAGLRRSMSSDGVKRPQSAGAATPPPRRQDVVLLSAWLQEQLDSVEEGDEESAMALWDDAMVALIRQVTVHCAERGQFLELARLQYLARLAKLSKQPAIRAAPSVSATSTPTRSRSPRASMEDIKPPPYRPRQPPAAVSLRRPKHRAPPAPLSAGGPATTSEPAGSRASLSHPATLAGRLERRLDQLCAHTLGSIAAPHPATAGGRPRSRPAAISSSYAGSASVIGGAAPRMGTAPSMEAGAVSAGGLLQHAASSAAASQPALCSDVDRARVRAPAGSRPSWAGGGGCSVAGGGEDSVAGGGGSSVAGGGEHRGSEAETSKLQEGEGEGEGVGVGATVADDGHAQQQQTPPLPPPPRREDEHTRRAALLGQFAAVIARQRPEHTSPACPPLHPTCSSTDLRASYH